MSIDVDFVDLAREFLPPNQVECILYHDHCHDGFAAAFAGWFYNQSRQPTKSLSTFPVKHGSEPPFEKFDNCNTLLVDFSYPRDTLIRMKEYLHQQGKKLLVLDHHISAEKDLHGIEGAFFDNNRSGAMLSWNYFFGDPEPPKLIKYIEDRDLWRWKYPETKPFMTAMFNSVENTFTNYLSFISNESKVTELIEKGKTMIEMQDKMVKDIASKAIVCQMKLDNKTYTISLLNTTVLFSEIGNYLSSGVDFVLLWNCVYKEKDHHFKVSLRSSDTGTNVGEIASKFGGGGHEHAAGFCVDFLSDIHQYII